MSDTSEHTDGVPSRAEIDLFLKAAFAPPDKDLIRRYMAEKATSSNSGTKLSEYESRKAKINLELNPSWQECQRDLLRESRPARPSKAISRKWRSFRWPIAAAVGLVCLYGVLWLYGTLTLPSTYSLASVNSYKSELVSLRDGEGDGINNFEAGLVKLFDAERTSLGLFPRYDALQVENAIIHLERVFSDSQDPFLRARAAFFLAKASFMQADTTKARRWLDQVLLQNVTLYRDDTQALIAAIDSLQQIP